MSVESGATPSARLVRLAMQQEELEARTSRLQSDVSRLGTRLRLARRSLQAPVRALQEASTLQADSVVALERQLELVVEEVAQAEATTNALQGVVTRQFEVFSAAILKAQQTAAAAAAAAAAANAVRAAEPEPADLGAAVGGRDEDLRSSSLVEATTKRDGAAS